MLMRLGRFHRNEEAQGIVEFALLASLMMLIFLGTVDFARFLYYDNAIRSAARTGAIMASNHCAYPGSGCGYGTGITTDDYVLQAVQCEAAPYVTLSPAPSTCDPTSSSPCKSSCLSNVCAKDICVSPSGAPGSARSSGTKVTVSVGYSFKPIAFVLSPFFNDQTCWGGSGDPPGSPADSLSNHHTLCASAVGKVY